MWRKHRSLWRKTTTIHSTFKLFFFQNFMKRLQVEKKTVGGFLRELRFPPPIKLTSNIPEILLKLALNNIIWKEKHIPLYMTKTLCIRNPNIRNLIAVLLHMLIIKINNFHNSIFHKLLIFWAILLKCHLLSTFLIYLF